MVHYICTGECGGESSESGSCNAQNCSKHEQQLTACDCEDGSHYGAVYEPEQPEQSSQ